MRRSLVFAAAVLAFAFVPSAALADGVPPIITQHPQSATTLPDTPVLLTVMATGDSPITYEWYAGMSGDTSTLLVSELNGTYTVPADMPGYYWVRAVNDWGSDDSDTATISVLLPPEITSGPEPVSILAGQAALLTVTATGDDLSYQWYEGESGATGQPVGTNSPTLDTGPLFESTNYWVEVTNAIGADSSPTAVVNIASGTNLISNGGFEAGKTGWIRTGLEAGDKHRCGDKAVASEGDCAFRFNKAGQGPDKLSQKVVPVGIVAGKPFQASFMVNATHAAAAVKLQLKVKYSGDVAPAKVIVATGQSAGYVFQHLPAAFVAAGAIKNIKVIFINTSTGGTLWIDDARLWIIE